MCAQCTALLTDTGGPGSKRFKPHTGPAISHPLHKAAMMQHGCAHTLHPPFNIHVAANLVQGTMTNPRTSVICLAAYASCQLGLRHVTTPHTSLPFVLLGFGFVYLHPHHIFLPAMAVQIHSISGLMARGRRCRPQAVSQPRTHQEPDACCLAGPCLASK